MVILSVFAEGFTSARSCDSYDAFTREAAMSWRSGQSYSQDLRDRVIAAADGGVPVRQAAVTFGVSIAYIYKALIRRRLTSDRGPNLNRGHRRRHRAHDQQLALAEHLRPPHGVTRQPAPA